VSVNTVAAPADPDETARVTYSIVARDEETGQLGVAVQTCMFAVGTIVPWARAGIGAVATQAMGEAAYGHRCLDAIAEGARAPEALDRARRLDPMSMLRQVGVVDAQGNAAAFTGDLAFDDCGQVVGDGFAVQANMMATPAVWPAMADAYAQASGDLADRMLSALLAGEAAGGDARGAMSAALVVVAGERDGGTLLDVRVDEHERPLDELARLVRYARAFRTFGAATDALLGGRAEDALRLVDDALVLVPGDGNLEFLRAGALVYTGHVDEAQQITRQLVASRPSWEVVIRTFATKGLLPIPSGVDLDAFVKAP
jgi:uncharacterized Ntn-hydrolase superfamily protein